MILPLVFVWWPVSKKAPKDKVPFYDWIFAALSMLPGIYIAVNYWSIVTRIVQVDPVTTVQLILGILLVLLLLEGTRRVVGIPLMIIAIISLVYMGFAEKIPGIFQGISFSVPEIVEEVFLTDEGIFSSSLGVSATYVMIFLIFGGFLEKSGVGDFFYEIRAGVLQVHSRGDRRSLPWFHPVCLGLFRDLPSRMYIVQEALRFL